MDVKLYNTNQMKYYVMYKELQDLMLEDRYLRIMDS